MSTICHDSMYAAGGHHQYTIADVVIVALTTMAAILQRASTQTGKTDTNVSATSLWITPIDYPIYFTLNGTAPATNGDTGHPLQVGDLLQIKGWDNIKNLKLIRNGSNSAKVNVTSFFNAASL